ncbi:hypothetical protein NDU88_005854 [Pleurodeles waltl]|uniref:Uncharacterized protein n=1 Tax=Pleurodeles waltl TaxID=8319 RepID=A0AAV7WZG9_PLEWA|nr:hypothetical protein NDU88_005854 [Pleurodeles waltl]
MTPVATPAATPAAAPLSGDNVPAAHDRWAPRTHRLATGGTLRSGGAGRRGALSRPQEEPPPDQAPLCSPQPPFSHRGPARPAQPRPQGCN